MLSSSHTQELQFVVKWALAFTQFLNPAKIITIEYNVDHFNIRDYVSKSIRSLKEGWSVK